MTPTTIHRESNLSLAIGLAVALLVHLCGLPWLTHGLVEHPLARTSRPLAKDLKPLLPEAKKISLGRDSPRPSAVAWISHDDFRKLTAPKSKTQQPALQRQVDPSPDALVRPNPTPPLPVNVAQARQASAVPPGQTPAPINGPDRRATVPSKSTIAPPEIPQQPLEITELIVGGKTTLVRPAARRQGSPGPKTPKDTARQTRGAHLSRQNANPTIVPRSDRESTPVRLQNHAEPIVPGGVLVGDGLEIKHVQPQFSAITRASAAPNNPVVRLVFNHRNGRVIQARLIRSSGYPNVDGPVLASLYKWRAQGQKLAQLDRPLELQIELILIEH